MRRAWRWALLALTGFSVLLCAATVALWVRSYRLTDRLDWANARGGRWVSTARGYVDAGFLWADWSASPEQFHGPRYQRDTPHLPFNWLLLMGGATGDVLSDWQAGGLAWHERRNVRRGTLHAIVVVPFWCVAAATALPTVAWSAVRVRARRRMRWWPAGRCRGCSYDLTANVSGVCPECGTAIAKGCP